MLDRLGRRRAQLLDRHHSVVTRGKRLAQPRLSPPSPFARPGGTFVPSSASPPLFSLASSSPCGTFVPSGSLPIVGCFTPSAALTHQQLDARIRIPSAFSRIRRGGKRRLRPGKRLLREMEERRCASIS